MSLRTLTRRSTAGCWESVEQLRAAFAAADAVVIGAGAGLSASAGLTYSGERFEKHFGDFIAKYGIRDMYSGGFYPFPTPEEYWAWWSRQIMVNRYERAPEPVYDKLLELVRDRDYFVLTTNVDHQFQLAGFDKRRLFYTQGDYGLWQCGLPCHQGTYDNEGAVRRMAAEQRDMRVPTGLIPRCPKCGRPMTLRRHRGSKVLYLELGVGANTPAIIKYPFWAYTRANPEAVYACVNLGEAYVPKELSGQSICIDADIGGVVERLA